MKQLTRYSRTYNKLNFRPISRFLIGWFSIIPVESICNSQSLEKQPKHPYEVQWLYPNSIVMTVLLKYFTCMVYVLLE